jgi:hypothetical protein
MMEILGDADGARKQTLTALGKETAGATEKQPASL